MAKKARAYAIGHSTKLSGKPLTRMVYDHIYGDIVNGVITTNDILTEGQLVQELNVSKSPVREALITLCDENVLQSIPRTGYKVVQIMPWEVNELIEARSALELFLLEKYFPLLDDEKIHLVQEYLREAHSRETGSKLTVQERWQINTDFHLLLASFAQNAWLSGLLEQTLRTCTRATTQYFLHNNESVIATANGTHPLLVDAFSNRDFQAARKCLLDDIQNILK